MHMGIVGLHPSMQQTQQQQQQQQQQLYVDNSDAASVVSTTSTNATNATNATSATNRTSMSATYYNKVKQQAEERLSLEVAMARARRVKKKAAPPGNTGAGAGAGAGTAAGPDSRGSGSKRGSASHANLARKASWAHGVNSMSAKKTQTKLPSLSMSQAQAYKDFKDTNGKAGKLDPRAANLPLLSISSMNADKRGKDGASGKQKEFITLPSLAGEKTKMEALSIGLAMGTAAAAGGGGTTLPAIKPRPKDVH
ncbi:hypothetical protein BC831DRAFT_466304 [Entophlyctis helioformis]|nr:hypothetical protein BC831DRAFT_466304 [Entophlyctis helioformis]